MMHSRTILIAGLSTLAVCGAVIGGAASYTSVAFAGDQGQDQVGARAEQAAAEARKALARNDAALAVEHAEAAVLAGPQNSDYRTLLGAAYLAGGRFLSAGEAFDDALTLDRGNGRAALNLALAKTALGDWAGARRTLNNFADVIAPGDRGLALALAGDPDSAIRILGDAARAEDATPTVRQNLALAFALADRWPEARAIAAIDLQPDQVDQRIMQWAAFARPSAASDQVASLLGVTPAADVGQPVQLALVSTTPQLAAAVPPAGEAPMVEATRVVDAAPAVVEVIEAAPVQMAATAPMAATQIVFGEYREIVQALPTTYQPKSLGEAPVRMAAAEPKRAKAEPASEPSRFASGDYYVQLGAYDSDAVAQEKWRQMRQRVASLGTLKPYTAQVKVDGASYHRLAVGGLARTDAKQLCRDVRARGGRCFVRGEAGDRLASWARGVQFASR